MGTHTTVHMDTQRSQPPPTSAVMTSTTETSNQSTPTSVFQHVIVQPGHLVQIQKAQPVREENAKNNGILCKFYVIIQMRARIIVHKIQNNPCTFCIFDKSFITFFVTYLYESIFIKAFTLEERLKQLFYNIIILYYFDLISLTLFHCFAI